ncbi:MAG: hypothetical protein COY40_06950 [Alphaproteobacteria bacterium CG_4_10_14_0_8_um_filter_53_9]|nr:MAG: hypothetical protein COY40_06950 [Alphaproteobacteria bacterium CG_4_10_14_0_8_um_filter_53_9]
MEILLALVLGTFFGVALNRAGATNPNYIINMLRLRDMHLMKAILLAVGVSSLLLFVGLAVGMIPAAHLSVKAAYWGVLLGGALLGVGFALSGYCPGTALAAAATGRRDALLFIVGGLLGAFAYMITYPQMKAAGLLEHLWGGEITLAQNAKYEALLGAWPALAVAGGIAVLLIVIATVLPRYLFRK